MNLNQQGIVCIATEKIVSNTNKPAKTVAKKLNKFLIKTRLNDEEKILVALFVMSGLVYN